MHRSLLPIVLVALVAVLGCDKIIGRQPLMPADGPIEGNTEVSIYVEECGDHNEVRKVLFDSTAQSIVTQKENEVKIRTAAVGDPIKVRVKLVLTNNRICDTGLFYTYAKMESSTINVLLDQGHPMGERRLSGWRPGVELQAPAAEEEAPAAEAAAAEAPPAEPGAGSEQAPQQQ